MTGLHQGQMTQAHSRRSFLDVHEWNGLFRGQSAHFKMTSVIGHVLSIDFPAKFQNWEATDPASLFDAPTIRSEANPKVGSASCSQPPCLPPCHNSAHACCKAVNESVLHTHIRGQISSWNHLMHFLRYFNFPLTLCGPLKAHVCKHLQREAKGCTHLVLWLDCDREGENICFEVRPSSNS